MLKPVLFFSTLLLLAACERDPLSTKGEVHLPEEKSASENTAIVPSVSVTVNIPDKSSARELGWDDLIPKEWLPDEKLVDQYNNGEIDDNDPRIIALKKRIQEMERTAPLNKQLDGQLIKLPGFVVPVETQDKLVTELLLVPYHGACIHVPAPPANQTVYVKTTPASAGEYKHFDTVWVTGKITLVKTKTDLAEAGYLINADKIEPYE